jgi:hypothetical protein
MDYDNEDLSPALKSRRPPPPVHTNDSDEDGGDRTPSPKPKHRHPLLDHNNHGDGEDLSPAPKRRQRPHRVPDSDEEQPHLNIISKQTSRERSPEEERRPVSVNGDEGIWLPVQSRNYDALLKFVVTARILPLGQTATAGVPEQVHGPRVCQRTFFPCY